MTFSFIRGRFDRILLRGGHGIDAPVRPTRLFALLGLSADRSITPFNWYRSWPSSLPHYTTFLDPDGRPRGSSGKPAAVPGVPTLHPQLRRCSVRGRSTPTPAHPPIVSISSRTPRALRPLVRPRFLTWPARVGTLTASEESSSGNGGADHHDFFVMVFYGTLKKLAQRLRGLSRLAP